jgi:ribosomal protein S18 acetylase RimI-like enzyme
MDPLIRPLQTGDRPAAARVLDDAVGAGFWSFDGPGDEIAFVAVAGAAAGGDGAAGGEPVAGVILCRLEPSGDPDAARAFGASDGSPGGPARDGPTLHVRAVAVAPAARRAGVARRLLVRAETEASARGARAAYLFAWLPAGRPEPAAVAFYLAAGYVPGRDIADFYAAGSLAAGAECPYCGAPPCRCAARPFTKPLFAT